jgi:hypothetical protein
LRIAIFVISLPAHHHCQRTHNTGRTIICLFTAILPLVALLPDELRTIV